MLADAKILQNDGALDVEGLERYINEVLGGTVGEDYAEAKPSITFTDGVISTETSGSDTTPEDPDTTPEATTNGGAAPAVVDLTPWIIGAIAVVAVLAIVIVIVLKTKKNQK